jgi:hypothetical protein
MCEMVKKLKFRSTLWKTGQTVLPVNRLKPHGVVIPQYSAAALSDPAKGRVYQHPEK